MNNPTPIPTEDDLEELAPPRHCAQCWIEDADPEHGDVCQECYEYLRDRDYAEERRGSWMRPDE